MSQTSQPKTIRTGMSCVITGGAGFIGCALSAELADRYTRVLAVDNLHPQVHARPRRPAALDARVELLVADVTAETTWERVLADLKPDVVVHLAAETGTGQSLTEATRHADVNVRGTTVMLDAFARHDHVPNTIVLSSSRAVYGEGAWSDAGATVYPGQRSREQLATGQWGFADMRAIAHCAGKTDPRPTSIYGATKLAQEHILGAWSLAFGSRLLTLRLQNVYGPGQSLSNAYTGICAQFAQWAREGRSIPIYEDGVIVRDFIFIDDVVRAFAAALDSSVATASVYDIGSGHSTTVHDLARLMARRHTAPAPHINANYRHGDVRHAVADITRAHTELDWSPRIQLEDGIEMLCRWIESSDAREDPAEGIDSNPAARPGYATAHLEQE